jgi:hypothetical protein
VKGACCLCHFDFSHFVTFKTSPPVNTTLVSQSLQFHLRLIQSKTDYPPYHLYQYPISPICQPSSLPLLSQNYPLHSLTPLLPQPQFINLLEQTPINHQYAARIRVTRCGRSIASQKEQAINGRSKAKTPHRAEQPLKGGFGQRTDPRVGSRKKVWSTISHTLPG